MTLYACGGEERRGEGERRAKVGRGRPAGESSEAKGKRESEEERREEDGKTRRTEMTLALHRLGRTPPSSCLEGPGKVLCPELLPHRTPGRSERWPPLPHKFLVAPRGSAPGLHRPSTAPAGNLPLCL